MTSENNAIIFKVPYADTEILAFLDEKNPLWGLVYNPLKLTAPKPWSNNCLHCQRKKHNYWSRSTQVSVKIMCSCSHFSPRQLEFILPPNYKIREKPDHDGWDVFRIDKELAMDVFHRPNQPPVLIGPTQDFRSVHVRHGIKLLLSARIPSSAETKALLRVLKKATPPKIRTPCWNVIESSARETR